MLWVNTDDLMAFFYHKPTTILMTAYLHPQFSYFKNEQIIANISQ